MNELKDWLETIVDQYNRAVFITDDPISIPHQFSMRQDIEIIGLLTATLSWGQRKTIIQKATELTQRMDNEPYQFVVNCSDTQLKQLLGFKHRTFNDTDLLCFLMFLRSYYQEHNTLEDLFIENNTFASIESGLNRLNDLFVSSPYFIKRTKKHLSSPQRQSACKRLNMYLRWMVRRDDRHVDFGLWTRIPMSSLMIPMDVHVERTAKAIGLLDKNRKVSWKTVQELTQKLSLLSPQDPVRHDYALFSLSEQNLLDKFRKISY